MKRWHLARKQVRKSPTEKHPGQRKQQVQKLPSWTGLWCVKTTARSVGLERNRKVKMADEDGEVEKKGA